MHQVRTVLANELGLDPGPNWSRWSRRSCVRIPSWSTAALPEPGASVPLPGPGALRRRRRRRLLRPRRTRSRPAWAGWPPRGARGRRTVGQRQVVAGPGRCGGRACSATGERSCVVTPRASPAGRRSTALDRSCRRSSWSTSARRLVTLASDPAERARVPRRARRTHADAPAGLALRADRLGDAVRTTPGFARLVERGLYLSAPWTRTTCGPRSRGRPGRSGCCSSRAWSTCWCARSRANPAPSAALARAARDLAAPRGPHPDRRRLPAHRRHPGRSRPVGRGGLRQVPGEQRPVLRDLLLRLVTPAPDGEPVRSRVPRRLRHRRPTRAVIERSSRPAGHQRRRRRRARPRVARPRLAPSPELARGRRRGPTHPAPPRGRRRRLGRAGPARQRALPRRRVLRPGTRSITSLTK